MWLPFKKLCAKLFFCFRLSGAKQSTFQKLKTADLFQKGTHDINYCFYQLANHGKKKEEAGWRMAASCNNNKGKEKLKYKYLLK